MRAKEIRQRAGRSRMWVAVQAGVSEPTARLYESDPSAVESTTKRSALASVYASLANALDASPPSAA
jgi:hypothetical protein